MAARVLGRSRQAPLPGPHLPPLYGCDDDGECGSVGYTYAAAHRRLVHPFVASNLEVEPNSTRVQGTHHLPNGRWFTTYAASLDSAGSTGAVHIYTPSIMRTTSSGSAGNAAATLRTIHTHIDHELVRPWAVLVSPARSLWTAFLGEAAVMAYTTASQRLHCTTASLCTPVQTPRIQHTYTPHRGTDSRSCHRTHFQSHAVMLC